MKEKVYAYLKTIPKGKVTTYGRIAQHLGNKHFARAVGNILHDNPDPSQYPCHRVVSSKGKVAENYAFGGGAVQRKRLEDEGIVFEPNGSVDLKKYAMDNYDLQMDMAKRIFLKYDQELIVRKFHLQADGDWIYLTYLNTPCRISRKTGSIEERSCNTWQECRNLSTVMTIYDLLCYHKGEIAPALLGQWCTVGTFVVTGVTNTETFTKKYAAMFDGRLHDLKAAAQRLGGIVQIPMAGADLTCKFAVTPFFPVLLQFWAGDEEFPPKLMLLWDRNTDKFMHFETTFYLQGDLLERIKNCIE